MTETTKTKAPSHLSLNTDDISIIKANGKHESFDADKLRFSLLHSGASAEAAEDVLAHILPELKSGMTTAEIYSHAFSILNQTNKPVARSYSLRRAVMD